MYSIKWWSENYGDADEMLDNVRSENGSGVFETHGKRIKLLKGSIKPGYSARHGGRATPYIRMISKTATRIYNVRN